MIKFLPIALFVLLVASIVSCDTYQKSQSSANYAIRSIILDGNDTISERDFGKFISWQCRDYYDGGKTLVEVGIFEDPLYEEYGFVLYDGGNKGKTTGYIRAGLNHRWNWSSDFGNYSIVIEPDGTGRYYDFTNVPEGESTTSKAIYKCTKR